VRVKREKRKPKGKEKISVTIRAKNNKTQNK
jgi:hypothetical protein